MRKTIKSTLAGLVVLTGVSFASPVDAAAKYIAYDSPTANSMAKTKAAIKKYPIKYKINKNDSVVNIAKAAGVSVKDFMKANQITNYKKVEVGSLVLATDSSIYSQLKKPYSYTEFISVDFKTIKKVNKSLKPGETKVKVKGVKGRKLVAVSYTYIKGVKKITSKDITVIKNPVNKIVEYGPNDVLENNIVNNVPRYEPVYKTYSKITEIPFKKLTIEDSNLLDGETYVKQKGINGKEEESYRVMILENGEEINKSDLKKLIISKPVDEITVLGSKIPAFPDSELSGSFGYNSKYRDTRYESNTTSTKMGYRVGQTTWAGQKITAVNDRLNTKLEEMLKQSSEEKFERAVNNDYINTIHYVKGDEELTVGMRVNYKTQKMFNDYKLFNEQIFVQEFIKLVNVERAKLNIPPIVIDNNLKTGNEQRVMEMAENGYTRFDGIAHVRPNKESYLTAFDYMVDKYIAEISVPDLFNGNIYKLMSEKYMATYAFNRWNNSTVHRAIMINPNYKKAYVSVKMNEEVNDKEFNVIPIYQVMIYNAVFN